MSKSPDSVHSVKNVFHRMLHKMKQFFTIIGKWQVPFFRNVPLGLVSTIMWKQINSNEMSMKASAISFNFFMALFPATIFFFSMLAFVPYDGFDVQFLDLLKLALPASAFISVRDTIHDILQNQRGALAGFGLFLAFFFSTNGIFAMMNSFNKLDHQFENRSFWKKRLIAAGLLILITLTVLVGLTSLIVENWVVAWIQNEFPKTFEYIGFVFWFFDKIILLGMICLVLAMIYRWGPSTITKWKFFSPGSWVGTLLFWATSSGFSYYVSHFSTYNKLYGSLGTILIIMLWLYINSFVIILGFELNVVVYGHSRKSNKKIQQ